MLTVDENFRLSEILVIQNPQNKPIRSQTISELCENSSEEAALIRLLLGTVRIHHPEFATPLLQDTNYAIIGTPQTQIRAQSGLTRLLKNIEIEKRHLDLHLQKNLRQRSFYKEILLEVLHHLLRFKKHQGSLAFVHLYRFLERISFVFPVVYASTTTDFKGAYNALKEFVNGSEKGELAFFTKFVEIVIEDTVLQSESTISFASLSTQIERDKAISVIKRMVNDSFITGENQGIEITIKNAGLLDLFINLRNRFFHFSSGNVGNITLVEVANPDQFFTCICPTMFSWLAILYFEIVRNSSERYV
ncbi:hypothetical protein K2X05_13285 [bacterium]|nr:hypothetical protein [bacterium]